MAYGAAETHQYVERILPRNGEEMSGQPRLGYLSVNGLPDGPRARAPSDVYQRCDIEFWRSQVIYIANCVS
jgi:hypothetical protein